MAGSCSSRSSIRGTDLCSSFVTIVLVFAVTIASSITTLTENAAWRRVDRIYRPATHVHGILSGGLSTASHTCNDARSCAEKMCVARFEAASNASDERSKAVGRVEADLGIASPPCGTGVDKRTVFADEKHVLPLLFAASATSILFLLVLPLFVALVLVREMWIFCLTMTVLGLSEAMLCTCIVTTTSDRWNERSHGGGFEDACNGMRDLVLICVALWNFAQTFCCWWSVVREDDDEEVSDETF